MTVCPRLYVGRKGKRNQANPFGAMEEASSSDSEEEEDEAITQVRKTPSRPRNWANFSLLQLYSRRNAWANLHLLGQLDTVLAAVLRRRPVRRPGDASQLRGGLRGAERKLPKVGPNRGPTGKFSSCYVSPCTHFQLGSLCAGRMYDAYYRHGPRRWAIVRGRARLYMSHSCQPRQLA